MPSRTIWPECAPLVQQLLQRLRRREGRVEAGLLSKWFDSINKRYGYQPAEEPAKSRPRKVTRKKR